MTDLSMKPAPAADQAEFIEKVRASQAAVKAGKEKYSVSPCKTYRREILSDYSTAQRLASLVLHLYNGNNPVRLDNLLANADQHHTRIALELLESYSIWGENDPDFMALAEEIKERRAE